jgi:hypothetical protein
MQAKKQNFKTVTLYLTITLKSQLFLSTQVGCKIQETDDIYSVNCQVTRCKEALFNPLPSLTLQSARDLNVPWQPKHSKALLF